MKADFRSEISNLQSSSVSICVHLWLTLLLLGVLPWWPWRLGVQPSSPRLTRVLRRSHYLHMNLTDPKYSAFGLVRDMIATAGVVANFDADQARDTGKAIAKVGRLMLTGEGSSRIFPARNILAAARRLNYPLTVCTEAARQAQEYDLSNWAVFAASNSGKTSEVIRLFQDLKSKGHKHLYGLTAAQGSK